MASYLLVHTVTGMPLQGYRLGSADASEVSEANARLAAGGSPYRLRPDGPSSPGPHTPGNGHDPSPAHERSDSCL